MQRLIIYLPTGGCDQSTERKLRAHFSQAEFVSSWRYGAMMWQDALARISN